MAPNPFLGVILHAIGGLAAASFYLPYKKVRGWSWETYWITGGVFSWLVAPAVFGLVVVSLIYNVPLLDVITGSPARAIWSAFGFGALWGIGGLTFGLSMRYLGIALGYAIALGFCAAFGTLVPPVFQGTFGALFETTSGVVVLAGVAACLLGIAFSGAAGMSKERELSEEQKKSTVAEFNFARGLVIAIACGLLSACMAFALAAGEPITKRAVELGTPPLWAGLPTLIVVLLGGLLSNAVWCFVLLARNRSFAEFLSAGRGPTTGIVPAVAPERELELEGADAGRTTSPTATATTARVDDDAALSPASLAGNYFFSALAGVTWYLQFFFYTMGSSKMGERLGFSSWTLHMASIIIFSTVWGIALREWRGTSRRTHALIGLGLAILILSTAVVGYGNYLGTRAAANTAALSSRSD